MVNIHFNTLAKLKIPNAAPKAKVTIMPKSFSFKAPKTVLNDHIRTKMNAPEIPGITIAQMATAPDKKM